jgi:hypothetical protein
LGQGRWLGRSNARRAAIDFDPPLKTLTVSVEL